MTTLPIDFFGLRNRLIRARYKGGLQWPRVDIEVAGEDSDQDLLRLFLDAHEVMRVTNGKPLGHLWHQEYAWCSDRHAQVSDDMPVKVRKLLEGLSDSFQHELKLCSLGTTRCPLCGRGLSSEKTRDVGVHKTCAIRYGIEWRD